MIEAESTIKLTTIYADGSFEMRNCATMAVNATDTAKMINLPLLKLFRIMPAIENERQPNMERKLNPVLLSKTILKIRETRASMLIYNRIS